jgi:uncharacterized protein (DUF2336 family)
MTAFSAADLLIELDDTIAVSSPERCARMLWRTVELLVAGDDRLQELQIGLLDDVLIRLTGRTVPGALAQLSSKLADLRAAPKATMRHLASCDDPAIATPVLRRSSALSSADLAAIATSCGEQHLLAVAERQEIAAPVTEILVRRGSDKVCLSLIGNPGAEFSDTSYAVLQHRGRQAEAIVKALVLRPGTPDSVVRELLSASPRTAADAKPGTRRSASPAGSTSSDKLAAAKRPREAEYAAARPEIVLLNRTGKLNDSTVNRFAIRGESANLFTALSVLSGAPIEVVEHVMAEPDCEGLVMACRASRLNWQTTLAILENRGARFSSGERERAQALFERLHLSTSQWTVRWGEISGGANDHTAKSGGSR